MSVRNMAIVLSPNLYAVNSENAMVALTMAQKVCFLNLFLYYKFKIIIIIIIIVIIVFVFNLILGC